MIQFINCNRAPIQILSFDNAPNTIPFVTRQNLIHHYHPHYDNMIEFREVGFDPIAPLCNHYLSVPYYLLPFLPQLLHEGAQNTAGIRVEVLDTLANLVYIDLQLRNICTIIPFCDLIPVTHPVAGG
jgi:hypothetical protein